MKTTLEEKFKYVSLHLDEGVPIFEIQEKYGLDRSTLNYYCALYRKCKGKEVTITSPEK
jgi:hypothetical protein